MDIQVYAVMYSMPFSYSELVSIHATEAGANASRDKMNDGNKSLTQKYHVLHHTLEK